VQSHALRQLHTRLPFGDGEYLVHDWMVASLREPNLVQRTDPVYLVEYRFCDWRLGYLVAERLADKVVVKTFLFLTMEGTPEAQLLREKLRLRQRDIRYCGLDRLSTFLLTDIQGDPMLRALFEECGCGHLFTMTKPEVLAMCRSGDSSALRSYLGVPDQRELQV
jgi:hypothetical protein